MSRLGLILTFVLSTFVALFVGILSNLAATYLAPTWTEQPAIVYIALVVSFLISLPISAYIFSRTLPEQPDRADLSSGAAPSPILAEASVDIAFANQTPSSVTPFLAPSLPPQGVYGRTDDLNKIIELLELEDDIALDVPPIALRGMGGIGKTTLSLALAHHEIVQRQFPDGVLWTALGPKPVIRWHLDSLGRALNLDLLPEHDEAACQAQLRSALYSRRVLLIVDDVWDSTHGRFFLVGGPRCRTLFTTREQPIAYDLATQNRSRRVDILKPEPALALLNSLAPQVVAADRKLAAQLCERLEYLPLGLTLAGRLLANEADVPQRMQRLANELIERREARLKLMQVEGRTGLDEENPVSLQAILGLSVDRLNNVDKERFALIGVFGGDPLTWDISSAAYMWQSSIEDAERTVSQLIHRGLVERRGDRYWMHSLLSDYACELIESLGL